MWATRDSWNERAHFSGRGQKLPGRRVCKIHGNELQETDDVHWGVGLKEKKKFHRAVD